MTDRPETCHAKKNKVKVFIKLVERSTTVQHKGGWYHSNNTGVAAAISRQPRPGVQVGRSEGDASSSWPEITAVTYGEVPDTLGKPITCNRCK